MGCRAHPLRVDDPSGGRGRAPERIRHDRRSTTPTGRWSRTVTGEVKVRVPLYGGKVEGWIVNGVSRAYDEEAQRLAAWLEREK